MMLNYLFAGLVTGIHMTLFQNRYIILLTINYDQAPLSIIFAYAKLAHWMHLIQMNDLQRLPPVVVPIQGAG